MTVVIERIGGGALGPPLSDPWDCSCYLVRGSRRAVVVDAGAGRVPLTVPSDADALLLTHLHLDHAGGAAGLGAAGLRVLAHPWTAAGLHTGDEERAGLVAARAQGVYPPDARLVPFAGVEPLEDGAVIDLGDGLVHAIDTPGHSEGHLAFLVDDGSRRTLLAGDLVFAGGRVVLQDLPDVSAERLRASLERVRALRPAALLAGHGAPVEASAGAHIEAALRCFENGRLPPPLEWPAAHARSQGGSSSGQSGRGADR
jgi:hydroxyacylglutathione hydrolase